MFFFQGDVGIGSFWKYYDAFEAAGCHVAWCVVEGGCVDFNGGSGRDYAFSHRQPMRPPCATGYPISDFFVLPDAIHTSVPVPCEYGRCGGRENPG